MNRTAAVRNGIKQPARTRALTSVVAVAAVSGLLAALALPARARDVPKLPVDRPNILILMSDDQPMGSFTRNYMPNVFSQVVDKGVTFDRAYVNASLCCPSRSQIMTGLYGHHNGVDQNNVGLSGPTFIAALHDLGYHTMLAGKYLNSYPCKSPRPEFEEWVCQGNGESDYSLINPTLNVNGDWVSTPGYTTDILAGYVTDFMADTPSDEPFFAMYTPTSPHLPANDPRCLDVEVAPNRPPNWDEDTVNAGKPGYVQRGRLTTDEIGTLDANHAAMTRAMPCLDTSMGTILSALRDREADTIVFFLSDNGYVTGEHRWDGKMAPYEESVHVPFAIRYPPLLPESAAFSSDALVQNVDIAPTIADLTGIHWGADGTSLVPLVTRAQSKVRDAALVEHCEGLSYPCSGYELTNADKITPPSFFAVVTDDHKYVEYVTGEKELYDLAKDPYELTNLAGDPRYAEGEAKLAGTLAQLTDPPVPETTIVAGPQGPVDQRGYQLLYFSQSHLATFQCRLDKDGVSGSWIACNGGMVVIGSLLDGSYTFLVQATDEHGVVDPTPASRSFSITSFGPDVEITSAPLPHQKDSTVSFTFASGTPGVDFQCRFGLFEVVATWEACDATQTYFYGPLADGIYNFEVKAVDQGGVESSPPAEWLFRIDNLPPQAIFTRGPKKFTQDTSASFTFYTDEPAVGQVRCRLDSNPRANCSSGAFSASNLAAGQHVLLVNATDELGNTGPTTFAWTIDLTAPVASILTGPSPFWPDDAASFTLSSNEPSNALYRCSVDTEVWVDCTDAPTVSDLLDGQHTFSVITIDQALNFSAPVDWSWTQDTVKPVVTITSGPPDPTQNRTATFQFLSNESGTRFKCSLDGAVFARCTSPKTYTSLAKGTHTFSVYGTDLAGNVSVTVSWTWTIT